MKIGMRKPSIKKSIKARTTGKMKRKMKSAINPLYGKKGMGLVNDPKKAIYNKVYNKTTFGVSDVVNSSNSTSTNASGNGGFGKGFLIVLAIVFFPITICYYLFKFIFDLVRKVL